MFALGVMLWEIVTLQRFAKGKASQASIDARVAGTEPRLSQVDDEVEPLLCEICDRAMHIDPKERYATAEEFRVAIEQYLLVSGDRVDSTTIAVVMQTAFTAERAKMYRMIDAHLKEAELSESLVRELRPMPSRGLGDELPTSVADLSELVESSRAELEAELRAAGKKRPGRWRCGWGFPPSWWRSRSRSTHSTRTAAPRPQTPSGLLRHRARRGATRAANGCRAAHRHRHRA